MEIEARSRRDRGGIGGFEAKKGEVKAGSRRQSGEIAARLRRDRLLLVRPRLLGHATQPHVAFPGHRVQRHAQWGRARRRAQLRETARAEAAAAATAATAAAATAAAEPHGGQGPSAASSHVVLLAAAR